MSTLRSAAFALSSLALAAAVLMPGSARSVPPTQGDLQSVPDVQIDRPGSSGPGQGELEMEVEFEIGDLLAPLGGDHDVPPGRATGMRGDACVYPFVYAVRNTDRARSVPVSNQIRLGGLNGPVLHSARMPALEPRQRIEIRGELALEPGRHLLYLQTDASGRLRERDEADNVRRVALTIPEHCVAPLRRTR